MERSYRDILSQHFHDRTMGNPSYSMRSFARDLEIPPSTLSEVLNGKKGISVERSKALAVKLRLPNWQVDLFCDLVAKEHAKSPKLRSEAKDRLRNIAQENQVQIINQKALSALASWVDLAILEMTYLDEFNPKSEWIASRLSVPEATVIKSFARLKVAKLIEVDSKTGKWIDVSPLFSTTDGVASESIRDFHRSVLNLGLKKLENTDVKARTVKSVVFSISKDNISKAQAIMDKAIAEIVSIADQSSQQRSDVMCFSAQLFSLLNEKK